MARSLTTSAAFMSVMVIANKCEEMYTAAMEEKVATVLVKIRGRIVAGKWFVTTERQGNTTVVMGSSRIIQFELLILTLPYT
jgi:hypothetical protein